MCVWGVEHHECIYGKFRLHSSHGDPHANRDTFKRFLKTKKRLATWLLLEKAAWGRQQCKQPLCMNIFAQFNGLHHQVWSSHAKWPAGNAHTLHWIRFTLTTLCKVSWGKLPWGEKTSFTGFGWNLEDLSLSNFKSSLLFRNRWRLFSLSPTQLLVSRSDQLHCSVETEKEQDREKEKRKVAVAQGWKWEENVTTDWEDKESGSMEI